MWEIDRINVEICSFFNVIRDIKDHVATVLNLANEESILIAVRSLCETLFVEICEL